jgi:hypothetical protein
MNNTFFALSVIRYAVSQWNTRKYILAGKGKQYERYQIYIVEKGFRKVLEAVEAGKDVSQFISLMDMNGFNAAQHGCLPCK